MEPEAIIDVSGVFIIRRRSQARRGLQRQLSPTSSSLHGLPPPPLAASKRGLTPPPFVLRINKRLGGGIHTIWLGLGPGMIETTRWGALLAEPAGAGPVREIPKVRSRHCARYGRAANTMAANA